MSCNCKNTSNGCLDSKCNCGIFIDILEGIVPLETIYASYNCDCDGYSFTFNEGSINNVFHEDNREVTVRYNSQFSRWEMVFYDNDLGGYIPFALYYTKDSTCPDGEDGFLIGSCGWDDNRNVTYVKVNSVVVGVAVWNGQRINGYKVYEYIPSVYPGTYTTSFTITFDIATDKWMINMGGTDIAFQVDPGSAQTNFPNGSFTAIAPFTETIFLDTYNGLPPTPGNESPSGTLNKLRIRAIECGCCDTEVVITIDGEEYTATVQYDEYGNILGYNGITYYTFTIGESTYYIFYLNGQWVVKEELSESTETIYSLTSTNECPFGSYADNTINQITNCTECVKTSFTYLGIDYEFQLPSIGTSNGKSIYAIVGVDIGPYLNSDIVISWVNTPSPRWNYSFITTPISSISNDTLCPLGNFPNSTTPEALFTNIVVNECGSFNPTLINVKGVKCFDCCDYDTPKNRNLLKKKKAIFVEEISDIRSKEIFGFKCGPEWDDLFRKHLIFDVLWCLPYGKICDEEQQCLINNLNENCNC